MSDVGDGGKCFPSKPIGRHRHEVFKRPELGSREPLTEDWQISMLMYMEEYNTSALVINIELHTCPSSLGSPTSSRTYANATPIVLNLKQLHAAIFDGDLDAFRASIKRVFNQLFERSGRSLNDFLRVKIHERACSAGSKARGGRPEWGQRTPAAIRLTTVSSSLMIGLGCPGTNSASSA